MKRRYSSSILERQRGHLYRFYIHGKEEGNNTMNNFIPISLIIIEMDKFLTRHNLPELTEEEIGNLKSSLQIESPLSNQSP